jgi:hypothetical protein
LTNRIRYDKPFESGIKYGILLWLACSGIALIYGIIFIPDVFTGERNWVLIPINILSITIVILYFKLYEKFYTKHSMEKKN